VSCLPSISLRYPCPMARHDLTSAPLMEAIAACEATKTVMDSKKTLTAKNLETLGAARLTELLLELSASEAVVKRRLRLELAGAASSEDVAREVRKRLATIARARSYVDWDKQRTLVADLEAQRRAILDHVAPPQPATAADLLWRFLGLAGSVFDRCDDGNGSLIVLAQRKRVEPRRRADRRIADVKWPDPLDGAFRSHSFRASRGGTAPRARPCGRRGPVCGGPR
jgi:hypothetical protein